MILLLFNLWLGSWYIPFLCYMISDREAMNQENIMKIPIIVELVHITAVVISPALLSLSAMDTHTVSLTEQGGKRFNSQQRTRHNIWLQWSVVLLKRLFRIEAHVVLQIEQPGSQWGNVFIPKRRVEWCDGIHKEISYCSLPYLQLSMVLAGCRCRQTDRQTDWGLAER